MPKFTALYPSITGGNESPFTMHAAGCSDIKREANKRSASTETFEAATIKDALDYMIDDELVEMGYSHQDVKVHACCRKA